MATIPQSTITSGEQTITTLTQAQGQGTAAATTVAAQAGTGVFGLTGGWYVFFGVGAGVLLSNTKAAPIVLAILSSALLYQISQLIEGK